MYRRMGRQINERMVASRHHLLEAATHARDDRTVPSLEREPIQREASLIKHQPCWLGHETHTFRS